MSEPVLWEPADVLRGLLTWAAQVMQGRQQSKAFAFLRPAGASQAKKPATAAPAARSSRGATRPQPRPATAQSPADARRSLIVVGSLIGVLALTSVLLRAMQGAPLTADAASGLMSTDSRSALLTLFNTREPLQQGRWKSIFVHQSKTAHGNAIALTGSTTGAPDRATGDHFVITNGAADGSVDGEIQSTALWDSQSAANPAPGQVSVDSGCVTICVVGDFDQSAPTATQLKRLEQLVQTLQGRLRIPAGQVWWCDYPGSPVGAGKFFPSSAFKGHLLR